MDASSVLSSSLGTSTLTGTTALAAAGDKEAAGKKLLDHIDPDIVSVGGAMRIARMHATEVGEYLGIAQRLMDQCACWAERLYSMVTGRDVLASVIFYSSAVVSTLSVKVLGLGLTLWLVLAFSMRPPLLKPSQHEAGIWAFLAHLQTTVPVPQL